MKPRNPRLAINGGRPVRTKPWFDNLTTGEEERHAVCEVLDSGYLSLFEGSHAPEHPFSFWGGPKVLELERNWCEYYDVKYAVSMNSATSGLYASIGALGLGYGDEVIVSPFTMSACAACTLIYGAIPIFADIELETGCLDPASVRKHISPRTRAIVVVHQFGIPADMDAIMAIAREHNIKVIEDCAQAHGARYGGRYVGTFGDIGVFSLNVNKTIQSGEGGVVVTNDEGLRYRLALIRNHGEAVVGPAGYTDITNIIGFNFRITEMQAAIANEQLKKLNMLTQIRLELVRHLQSELAGLECLGLMRRVEEGCVSTYYVFPLKYIAGKNGLSRTEFTKALEGEGVIFSEGYVKPLYFQPIYSTKNAFKYGYPFTAKENLGIRTNYYQNACPHAEQLHFKEILINEYVRPPHDVADMNEVVTAIKKILGR